MSDVVILGFGAVSALGEGAAAAHAGPAGERARVVIQPDAELTQAGLRRPFVARASIGSPEDRATELLVRALSGCAASLDAARPGWRQERVGLILGTSSGGMRAAERAYESLAQGGSVADGEAATYFGPMARATRSLGCAVDPAILVLGACASSTLAIGLGMRCLEQGACDLVLAGGFDEVTVFVAAGFEALRATTASPPPRPFRIGRDGMALGEGAAVLALARSGAGTRPRFFLAGFGAGADAVHLTAPDREGSGLARAAGAALEEAGQPVVDLVSAHATATPFNDAAEMRALQRALGGRQDAPVVHPFKAQIGHTLGAAGALELLACLDAMERGVLPAAAGEGAIDPEAPARLLDRAAAAPVRTALKLSSAFGGANASLVVTDVPAALRPVRPVFVQAVAHVARVPELGELAAALGMHADRLARADPLVWLALDALRGLRTKAGPLHGAGIVAGSAFATVETNALFAAGIRAKGARGAEPRRFPYTSPNAVAGECSIAFGLTGPGFCVGGGLHAGLEALAAAALLVGSGDADRMVVVAVDEVGPNVRAFGGDAMTSGAVALLLTSSPEGARARVAACTVRRAPGLAARSNDGPIGTAPGHLALLSALDPRLPLRLVCASPPDALAVVRLEPV